MEPERWKRTEELYHAASALQADDRGPHFFATRAMAMMRCGAMSSP